jgi:hypothetical protein
MTDSTTRQPTDAEKRQNLVDQYRKLKDDPKAILFCPWCSKISKAPEHGLEEVACCQVFAGEWAMIGVRQIESVERQMAAIHAGKMTVVNCPYCGTGLKKWTADPTTWIHPNVSPWCCELLHDAVLAIAQRQETVRRIELAKRIQDGYAKAGRN